MRNTIKMKRVRDEECDKNRTGLGKECDKDRTGLGRESHKDKTILDEKIP